MSEHIAAFPLCWPEGRPRCKSRASGAKFGGVSVYGALCKLKDELGLLKAKAIILSTSIPLRNDGLPYSKPPVDGDPGAAAYFQWRTRSYTIACDQYADVASNLRGIALVIEAMRAIERHGSTGMLEQAFTGFMALPSANKPWTTVLGLKEGSSKEEIRTKYRALALERHPDKGGSDTAMAELNVAYEQAMETK